MSPQLQAALAVILSFFGLFLLWYLPDYLGAIASSVTMLISVALYYLSQRRTADR